MRRTDRILALFGTAVIAALPDPGRSALATQAKGYESAKVAAGRFSGIDLVGAVDSAEIANGNRVRPSRQWMKGQAEVYVQRNIWQPGGDTGWHSHPGRSLIMVTKGTVTDYEGDDPHCTPHIYTKGMGFVDFGGSHAHIIRNESDTEAETVAVQFIPASAQRRIDMPAPANCRF